MCISYMQNSIYLQIKVESGPVFYTHEYILYLYLTFTLLTVTTDHKHSQDHGKTGIVYYCSRGAP